MFLTFVPITSWKSDGGAPILKRNLEGWWDSSMGKGTYCQV